MDYLRFYIPPLLTVIILTALVCQYCAVRRRRISLLVPAATTLVTALAVTFYWMWTEGGWHVLTPSYWEDQKGGIGLPLFMFGGFTCTCFLPALLVVLYYRRRSKRRGLSAA